MGPGARRSEAEVITLFAVRPKGLNIGNEAIFVAMRHLLRETFGGLVNIVPVPAAEGGLLSETVHEMNLYGHGVIVGGGNLYENGQLDVDTNALRALRPPLMLFSLSHGRIYDHRHQFVPRTDAMPDEVIAALHQHAAISLVRDEATLAHLRALSLDGPILGGCPTLVLSQVEMPRPQLGAHATDGVLLSVRQPRLMSIPARDQSRIHGDVASLIAALKEMGIGPVRLLCHDTRDLSFASTLGDVEYILADDIYSHLELLRRARLVVSFRLHAFLPCLSFGTPAVNISYDERSLSLVRTIGLGEWDIDYVRTPDLLAAVRDRCARLDDLRRICDAAQPTWTELQTTMRESMAAFARLVIRYAGEAPPPHGD